MFTKADMRKVVSAYESNGIVTRNDFFKIDSRPLAKEVLDELRRIGYTEAMIHSTDSLSETQLKYLWMMTLQIISKNM